MEESKELQGIYTLFRSCIYASLFVEFFMYCIDPASMGTFGEFLSDVHDRLSTIPIYQSLPLSKLTTLTLVIITCIGTRNKKQIEFNPKTMIYYPLFFGMFFVILSVVLYGLHWFPLGMFGLNIWCYMVSSVAGVVLVHIALDNISKYFKDGMAKDRFNFENESFEQCEKKSVTPYSVNIPMRYYYKGKFREGWINIINPFRGRRRTNRAIFVKLIYWLKLNVNNLKSAIWAEQRKITENIRKGMTSGWLGTSVGNYRFCFPEFPTNLRTLNGLNSIILSQFGMCK